MSILSVDTIQPIGSGSTVTLNAAKIVVGTGITFESNGQAIYAGIITATSFSGSGANLTSLPAANLTGTLPAISGANLTSLPAANLTGTLPAISGANLTSLPIGGSNAISLNDNVNLNIGTGNDFQLYHSASDNNSYIKETGSGSLMIQGDVVNIGSPTSGEYYIRAFENADVQIRYNNSTKIQTTNTGAVVTGICTATTFEATTFSKTPTNTPAFHAYRAGNFSPTIADQTTTKMTIFTTETLDSDSAYDNSSSGTTANRFTVPAGKGGYYQVAAGLNFYADSNDMKHARVMIYKNGGITISAYAFVSSYAAGTRHLQCDVAGMLNLSASDYLEVYAYLDTNGGSGGYISNDANGLRGNYFSAFKLII